MSLIKNEFCDTYAMLDCQLLFILLISKLFIIIWPLVGSNKPENKSRKVLFPEPFLPIIPIFLSKGIFMFKI